MSSVKEAEVVLGGRHYPGGKEHLLIEGKALSIALVTPHHGRMTEYVNP